MRSVIVLLGIILFSCNEKEKAAIVFQTDFGLKDGAVAAMKGVARSVSDDLELFDLTHEIPSYNIWEAAYRLRQVIEFWPKETVFVSVIDPGVGTDRRSIVALTNSGHYIITPDNGTLTLIANEIGIKEARLIDEEKNRRKQSGSSYTFHGRDVYAYTAARLAAGTISYEDVGPAVGKEIVLLKYEKAELINKNQINGGIPVLDIQYGNVWTNIHDTLIQRSSIRYGDTIEVNFFRHSDSGSSSYPTFSKLIRMPFVETFGAVAENQPLAYLNSLMNLSFALNMANFSEQFNVQSGPDWTVTILKQ